MLNVTVANMGELSVLAASTTAFSAALAKLSVDVPTTSITFCGISGLLDFDSVGLYRLESGLTACGSPSIVTDTAVPLSMHRMNPECLDSDRSGPSIAAILLREEPDEDEEEEDDRKEEDDDGDEGDDGYSE